MYPRGHVMVGVELRAPGGHDQCAYFSILVFYRPKPTSRFSLRFAIMFYPNPLGTSGCSIFLCYFSFDNIPMTLIIMIHHFWGYVHRQYSNDFDNYDTSFLGLCA